MHDFLHFNWRVVPEIWIRVARDVFRQRFQVCLALCLIKLPFLLVDFDQQPEPPVQAGPDIKIEINPVKKQMPYIDFVIDHFKIMPQFIPLLNMQKGGTSSMPPASADPDITPLAVAPSAFSWP